MEFSARKETNLQNVQLQYADVENLDARINLHNLYSVNTEGWTKWLHRQMQIHEESRILEVGAGNGSLWSVQDYHPPARSLLILSDPSKKMINAARNRLKQLCGSVKYVRLMAENIPFADATFDICIANHMLHHASNLKSALCEMRRILKPSGTLYASTFGEKNLQEISNILKRIDSEIQFPGNLINAFNLQNGRRTLERQFATVDVVKYDDALRVTDAEDLMQYILSSKGITNVCERLDPPKRKALRRRLNEMVAADGHIHVTKESGLFIVS